MNKFNRQNFACARSFKRSYLGCFGGNLIKFHRDIKGWWKFLKIALRFVPQWCKIGKTWFWIKVCRSKRKQQSVILFIGDRSKCQSVSWQKQILRFYFNIYVCNIYLHIIPTVSIQWRFGNFFSKNPDLKTSNATKVVRLIYYFSICMCMCKVKKLHLSSPHTKDDWADRSAFRVKSDFTWRHVRHVGFPNRSFLWELNFFLMYKRFLLLQ